MDGIDTCSFLVPFVIVISVILFVVMRKRINKIKFLINVLIIVFSIMLIDKLFFPLPLSAREIEFARNSHANTTYYNAVPFNSIQELLVHNVPFSVLIVQIGGNIALFIPLGFLVMWKQYVNYKKARILKTILVCALFSTCLEIIQLIISLSYSYSYRYSDIDDVILNTLGGIVGALLFSMILPLIRMLFFKSKRCNDDVKEVNQRKA